MEGASDTFDGDPTKSPIADVLERYGYDGSDYYGRARFDDRFNVEKEPNEPNHLDWVVEIDPYDPTSTPVKRTALGRMAHGHTAASYSWDLFVLAGNPKDPVHGATFHAGTSENGWFVCPDNLTFDPKGRMFVATDGANDFDIADGIYGVDTEGRGLPKLLFATPIGAEATGPCFTPDGTTLFVSVQHPAEDSDDLANASTRWPDFFDSGVPRPAVVAIQRLDGGEVAV